jgi:hypothetical protein
VHDHAATPLSALKDPSSFGPPPKKVNYNGARPERAFDGGSQKGPLTPAEYRAREEERLKWEKEEAAREKEARKLEKETKLRLRAEQQGEQEVSGRLSPYKTDSTGLSTTQFAPPVARRVAADGTVVIRPTASSMSKPKPSLPPRLPDRQNGNSKIGAPSPPPRNQSALTESPSSRGQLSQGSLGASDAISVSTPSYKSGSPEPSPTDYNGIPRLPARIATGSSSNAPITALDNNAQLNELQSRFARMKATSPTTAAAPTQGGTWAEQAALRTSSSLRGETVTKAAIDASSLASTSKNVRERHGAQAATAWNAAQKYGKKEDTTSHTGSSEKTFHQGKEGGSPIELRDNTMLPVKKAPPPIPKKKGELFGDSTQGGGPPPIPLSTKPK